MDSFHPSSKHIKYQLEQLQSNIMSNWHFVQFGIPTRLFSHLYEDSETHTKHDNFSFVLEVLIKGDISNISTMLDLKVYKREFECALFRSFHPLRLHLSIYPSLFFPLLFLSILCILSVVSNIHNF